MSKKPKGCITVEKAKMLERNYVEKIEKPLEKVLGCEECREFWWSMEDLEDYIKYAKKKAKKKGYKNLGMRFYLGKYGKHHDEHESDEDHDHEHVTLFMVPTGVHSTKKLTPITKTVGAKAAKQDENITEVPPYNRGGGGKVPYDG